MAWDPWQVATGLEYHVMSASAMHGHAQLCTLIQKMPFFPSASVYS